MPGGAALSEPQPAARFTSAPEPPRGVGVLARLHRLARGAALGVAVTALGAAAGIAGADWRLRHLLPGEARVELAQLAGRVAVLEAGLHAGAAERDALRREVDAVRARLDEPERAPTAGAAAAAPQDAESGAPSAAASGAAPSATDALARLQALALRAQLELAAGNRGIAADDVETLRVAVEAYAKANALAPQTARVLAVEAAAVRDDLRAGRPSARARLELLWQLLAQAARPDGAEPVR